ncbi:MerR family transcriptional regulator [Selenihalanaerobacter shriftii]|uniref:HTH merR-type domain-containing protein n=1 Tax=Selenihalanaerobacter shriftii TaxID=142842 RepID=A0A1T4NV42_9FIRM|nr:hypothetical protein [Selenihalanaerobacter shriftii]SJZ83149.1 hypothetical protein SAMN02745118_01939 [Selenihalanaerobacter shriftii]
MKRVKNKFENNIVTASDAAKIIGVARGTIIKWKNKGKLNAVNRPSIDGFGKYLYSKGDV